jgi:hypothetical protein
VNFGDFTRFANLGAISLSNSDFSFGAVGALAASRRRITAISCSTGHEAKCSRVNGPQSVAWRLL